MVPSFFAVLIRYDFFHELQNISCLRHVQFLILEILYFLSVGFIAVHFPLRELIHRSEALSSRFLKFLGYYLHIIHRE